MSCAADLRPAMPVAPAPLPPGPPAAPPPAYPPAVPSPYPTAPLYAPGALPPAPLAPSQPVYLEYAGFWRRFAAAFIDGIALNIVVFPIALVTGFSAGLTGHHAAVTGAQFVSQGFGLVAGWLYYSLLESSQYQATLGKMALGIIVTDLDGNRITWGRATGRHFGKFVSALTCLIGYLMAGFTESKQALHDMMAGCLVVCKPR